MKDKETMKKKSFKSNAYKKVGKKNRSWQQLDRDADKHYEEWYEMVYSVPYKGSNDEKKDLIDLDKLSRKGWIE